MLARDPAGFPIRDTISSCGIYARSCKSVLALRTSVVLATMAATACRVCSIPGAKAEGIGGNRGHRVIDIPAKGSMLKRFVMPMDTVAAVGAWLDEHGHGPGWLFCTATGNPVGQASLFRMIRRVAMGAGIPRPRSCSRTASGTPC